MTARPYTDADLRTEAAKQHHDASCDHDYVGIGERMNGTQPWDSLGEDDFNAAQDAIDDLLTNAADTSEWAIALGAAGLKPTKTHGWRTVGSGWDVAIQIATSPQLTDDARDELAEEITKAVEAVVHRVLCVKPA